MLFMHAWPEVRQSGTHCMGQFEAAQQTWPVGQLHVHAGTLPSQIPVEVLQVVPVMHPEGLGMQLMTH
jgi:hypothetical protein